MKRVFLLFVVLLTVSLIGACVEIEDVESIEINWIPQLEYDLTDTNTIDLSNYQVTVNFVSGAPLTKSFNDTSIEKSGSGLDGNHLVTNKIGKFEIVIAYEDASIELIYYVTDDAFVAAFNALENYTELTSYLYQFYDPNLTTKATTGTLGHATKYGLEKLFLHVGDGTHFCKTTTHPAEVWQIGIRLNAPTEGQIYTTTGWKDISVLPDADDAKTATETRMKFNNAYEIQQVILASVEFRTTNRNNSKFVFQGGNNPGGIAYTSLRNGSALNWSIMLENMLLNLENEWMMNITADKIQPWDEGYDAGKNIYHASQYYPVDRSITRLSTILYGHSSSTPVIINTDKYEYTISSDFVGLRDRNQTTLLGVFNSILDIDTTSISMSNAISLAEARLHYMYLMIAVYDDVVLSSSDDGGENPLYKTGLYYDVSEMTLRNGVTRTTN